MRLTFISKLQTQVTMLIFDAHKKAGRQAGRLVQKTPGLRKT